MARFIGQVRGQAGNASRLGSPNSGITVEANGWDVGVRVCGCDYNGDDVFTVFATGGSNNGGHPINLGTVRLIDGQIDFAPARDF